MNRLILFSLAVTMLTISGYGQERVLNIADTAYSREMTSYTRSKARNIPVMNLSEPQRSVSLPSSVDNSLNKYFPAMVSQVGFSCQQVAGVSYCYAYELNRLRDLSSADQNNVYPSHYTWNYMNNGEFYKGVSFFYSWDVIKKQGHPAASDYPAPESMGILGWMSGYDRYHAGMKNRLKKVSSIPVNTEEGILTLKHYLFNHLDGSSTGGIVVFGASGMLQDNKGTIPDISPEAGKHILTGFYPMATHGMTIVGYNDSIRFDLNGDGQYTNDVDINGDGKIDPRDWEWGAYRMADSYGTWFEDNGFCWIMYRALALGFDEGLGGWTPTCGAWNNSVFVVEPIADYTPLLTMKVSLNHTLRNTISIKAGISGNPKSMFPDYIQEFPVYNYQGNNYPLNILQPELPDLEAGFDITPLLSHAEPGQPCRLFFILDEDDPYKTGKGTVNAVSFISYLNGTESVPAEAGVPVTDNSVTILSAQFTPAFDKVAVATEDIPAFSATEPYSVQLQASGGKVPYTWSLLHPIQKNPTDSLFPLIQEQTISPQSLLVPFQTIVLPFSFPFYGKTFDTVYMNAYGFITFSQDELPYHYMVDQEEMLKNNKLIAPLFALDFSILPPSGKMWYQSGPGWAGFRWSTCFSGSETVSAANFALRLYPDGRFEFLYDDCHSPFMTKKTFSGFSSGDDHDYSVWTNWDLTALTGKSFLFEPVQLPVSAAISSDGLLTVGQAAEDRIFEVNIDVTDASNITTVKQFSLTSQLDIETRLVADGEGLFTKGKPVSISVFLKNKGAQNLSDLHLTIEAIQNKVILTDSVESIPLLNTGSTLGIENAFMLQADTSFTDKTPVSFILTAKSGPLSWRKALSFPFSAPEISVSKPAIHDGVNASLDPGEVADLLLTISNEGSCGMKHLEITLSTGDSLIKILSPVTLHVDSLSAFDTLNLKYMLKASRYSGMGDTVPMMITLRDTADFEKKVSFFLTTGKFPVAILNLSADFTSSSWMTLALDELGVKREIFGFLPQNLGDRAVVFANMGFQPEDSLDITEQNLLDSYLQSGGNIYLEQFKRWNKDTSGFFSRFHYTSDTVPVYSFLRIDGVDATLTEAMQFNYASGSNSASFAFIPVDPARSIMNSPETHPLQIAYEGTDYKTIGSMVAFGALSDSADPSNKKMLMRKYLGFFGIDPDGVKAYFHCNQTEIHTGDTIQFTDDSFDHISQWQWEFPGGEPSASTDKNPVVRYPSGGSFNVSLTVAGNNGTGTIRKKEFIRVNSSVGVHAITPPSNDFVVYPNPAQNTLTIENKAGVNAGANLEIFDWKGMRIVNRRVNNQKTQLNLEKFNPGIYLFLFTADHSTQKIKVIVL